MTFDSPITDIDWLYCIDPIEGMLWSLWAVEVLTDNGYTLRGTIQGDGEANYDGETFQEDDTV